MYQNKLQEIEKIKAKIDSYRPLSKDILRQIQEYYKITKYINSHFYQ